MIFFNESQKFKVLNNRPKVGTMFIEIRCFLGSIGILIVQSILSFALSNELWRGYWWPHLTLTIKMHVTDLFYYHLQNSSLFTQQTLPAAIWKQQHLLVRLSVGKILYTDSYGWIISNFPRNPSSIAIFFLVMGGSFPIYQQLNNK